MKSVGYLIKGFWPESLSLRPHDPRFLDTSSCNSRQVIHKNVSILWILQALSKACRVPWLWERTMSASPLHWAKGEQRTSSHFFVTSFSKVPMASWVQSPVPAVLVRLPGLSRPQKQQPVVRVSAGAWVLLGLPGSCTASLTGTRLRCTRRHEVFEGTKIFTLLNFTTHISLYLFVSLCIYVPCPALSISTQVSDGAARPQSILPLSFPFLL